MNFAKPFSILIAIVAVEMCVHSEAAEPQSQNAADILREAAAKPASRDAVFRVPSDVAGEIVSANDVRHGLHRFHEEDIASAFVEEHPLLLLSIVMAILVATLLLENRHRVGADLPRRNAVRDTDII
ncbi:MAG: hypothetical protein KDB27_16335 [Planctomycetales bacterium]|nr:hypothetical protein [Planctomycetales bacterium]